MPFIHLSALAPHGPYVVEAFEAVHAYNRPKFLGIDLSSCILIRRSFSEELLGIDDLYVRAVPNFRFSFLQSVGQKTHDGLGGGD